VHNVISTTTTTARRRRDVCVRSVVSGIVLPCAYYTDVYTIMVTRHTRIAMLVVRPSPVSPVGNGFLISAIVVTAAQQIYNIRCVRYYTTCEIQYGYVRDVYLWYYTTSSWRLSVATWRLGRDGCAVTSRKKNRNDICNDNNTVTSIGGTR